MILISHRGNIDGKTEKENEPNYILQAIELGYDVEVDVWLKEDKLYLGHDEPQYITDESFLKNPRLWCHAKDIDTLYHLLSLKTTCFFHHLDQATLTSNNYIWTYPGYKLTVNSICVLPESIDEGNRTEFKCFGICSDIIKHYDIKDQTNE